MRSAICFVGYHTDIDIEEKRLMSALADKRWTVKKRTYAYQNHPFYPDRFAR